MSGRALRALALLLPLVAACGGANVDPAAVFEVADVTTGYVQTDPTDGRNRIVPSVAFRLKTRPGQPDVESVAINVGYRKANVAGDEAVFDDKYLQRVVIRDDGMSDPLVVNADTGFTGDAPQTPAEMLQNAHFQDLVVNILVKHGSGAWAQMHSAPVERRILAR